ncbi:hypothetical protein [Cerasicoccus fimbriatus]|uniref:hypothetical protein n=1 Tax=Cerasicoccus fimbriatus TaxID=3014554 RepID=UPI0022B43682|nr:hypothetical protein [Cerasicoccus sp. TK19100]
MLLVIMCLVAGAVAWAEDYRTFTDTQGRTMEAKVLSVNGDTVTIERSDGLRFQLGLDKLSEGDNEYIAAWVKEMNDPYRGIDERVRPGNTFAVSAPELSGMNGGNAPEIGVRIPENYDPTKPSPLLMWYTGGGGSSDPNKANGIVDFKEFIVLAMPYPNKKFPRIAVNDGDIDKHWEMQQPLLQKVIELIPNIDPNVRIVAGTSSGAHNIGSGLDQKWDGFCDYFNAFVLHEGGTSPDMEFRGASRKLVLVVYGEKSKSREWQEYFNGKIEEARAKLTMIPIESEGHGLGGEGKKAIAGWIKDVAIPELSDS